MGENLIFIDIPQTLIHLHNPVFLKIQKSMEIKVLYKHLNSDYLVFFFKKASLVERLRIKEEICNKYSWL